METTVKSSSAPNAVILLRGLARESGHWGSFPALLAERLPECRVAALDLPGMGERAGEHSPRTIEAIMAEVRREALQRFGGGPFGLISISLGGMVALQWMQEHPDEIARTVLINSSDTNSPFYKRLRWQIWRPFIKILCITNPRDREQALLQLLMNNEKAREEAFPLWARLAQENVYPAVTFGSQLWAASQFKGLRDPIDVPVLLLNSLGDRLVDPSCSEALHQKWGWPIERHPWAGHDLPWDDPEWVLYRIQRYFAPLP